MSPEQLKSSRDVDARSDIWSLGVVHLRARHRPQAVQRRVDHRARAPGRDGSDAAACGGAAPASFEAVIARCLEKDPARRYQDVAELAHALAPFVGARGFELAQGVARVRRGANTPIVPMASAPGANVPTTLRGASGVISRTNVTTRSWKVPALIGLGAACGIGIAILLVSGTKDQPVAASPEGETTRMNAEPSTPTPSVETAPAAVAPPVEATPRPTIDPANADAAAKKAAAEKVAAEKAAAEKVAAEKAAAEKAAAEKAAAEKAAKLEAAKATKPETTKAKPAAKKTRATSEATPKIQTKPKTETKPKKTEDLGDSRI